MGLRRTTVERVTLPRKEHEVETRFGLVAGKVATLPNGTERFSPEYEACRQLASKHGVPLADVMSAARTAARGNS